MLVDDSLCAEIDNLFAIVAQSRNEQAIPRVEAEMIDAPLHIREWNSTRKCQWGGSCGKRSLAGRSLDFPNRPSVTGLTKLRKFASRMASPYRLRLMPKSIILVTNRGTRAEFSTRFPRFDSKIFRVLRKS